MFCSWVYCYHLVISHSHGKSFINGVFNGKIHYQWTIFHGYVQSPEGIFKYQSLFSRFPQNLSFHICSWVVYGYHLPHWFPTICCFTKHPATDPPVAATAHLGSAFGHFGALQPHGHADARLVQRRRVVHAVARPRGCPALLIKAADVAKSERMGVGVNENYQYLWICTCVGDCCETNKC